MIKFVCGTIQFKGNIKY